MTGIRPRTREPAMTDPTQPMRVTMLRRMTPDILAVTLAPAEGAAPAPPPAGAHVDLHIPHPQGPLVRQYSLTGPPGHRPYELAVLREAHSRGGSAFLHDRLAVGDVLAVGPPRNRFPACETAAHSILIAGGIGIAPIWSLAQRLTQCGRPWELHYAARGAAQAAFLPALLAQAHGRVTTCFRADGQPRLALSRLASACAADTHVYCCGPARMMTDFEAAFAHLPAAQRHREHFTPVAPPATEQGFELVLARSRRTLQVPPGRTILETVRGAGISAPFSCQEGVCGKCETRVIEGIADHRDSVLSPAEHARGDTMMICCSGAKSGRLVLDL
ncbi:ferredoxin [Gluconacetobacter sacchari DSM 12717]|nr:PDR/VanB family oxidoreductase [Gluconacetobacter sacchari]GBQ18664.1 ferredoxin [Gluconacetobacter sacchari DSM 12717]